MEFQDRSKSVSEKPQHRQLSSVRGYVRAFNVKIVPIMLTIISTVLGLLPFLSDGPDEVFWFDFAAGTVSGLVFSIIALVLYLPVFCIRKKNVHYGRMSHD